MHSTTKLTHRLIPVLLIIILAIAAGLRFYNLNWDNGIFAHPDERSTVAFYAPTIRWPEDSSTILDPRTSTLNPFWDVHNLSRRSYTYGHFPLYTLVLVARTLNDLAPLVTSLPLPYRAQVEVPTALIQFLETSLSGHGYAQIGRTLAALADLFTVYLIFILGRRLYGSWGGVLAAALSTFTVLQIQLAHFFAVDPISTTFTLLALYGAILMYDRQSIGAAILTGVGIALAVSSKFSALPVAFAPIVAGYLATLHQPMTNTASTLPGTGKNPPSPGPQPTSHISQRMIGLVVLALVVAFIIFAITSPFVLLDFENFKRAVLDEQGNMVSGVADFPFTRQYRHTPAYWYFIEQQLRWGMGWPLGLLAFSGLLWVIIKAVRGKAQPGEWIILWWIILYFGPTGLFLAKFMRYMVPVVPLFILFGAGMVVALWRSSERIPYRAQVSESTGQPASQPTNQLTNQPTFLPAPLLAKLTRIMAITIAIIALTGAALWSLAFVNGVYGTEHTWVTFARWTYANVPDNACIAYEHWDDRMPTDISEPAGNARAHNYYQPQLPMYDDDSQQKYEFLRETLMNCDYVVLASNRLWRTIPRLPERYPMSTRYYEALFSGELGFEPVYTVETPPRLGPLVFDDQPADESFTVYDHPKPIMFKKTHQLSPTEWDVILDGTWQGATYGYVGKPTLLMRLRGLGNTPSPVTQQPTAKEDKSLLLASPVDQLPVVDDFRWNPLANGSTLMAILVWWLIVMLISVIAFPITYLLFNKLPERGYGLSKSLGVLLVSYFIWLNSSLGWLSNRLITALIAVILLTGFGLWVFVKHRHQLAEFLRQQQGFILTTEIIFSLIYLFFVFLRILNPDLWQPWLGGEKMLEIGFLNAVVKSAKMPPYDPFFAGGIINYYYYGLFLVGVLIKLSGIQPSIAFNLAVPTLAALTGVNVFSLAVNLTASKLPFAHLTPHTHPSIPNRKFKIQNPKSIASGLLAVLFIVFIGNLEGAAQFMRELARLSQSDFQSAIPGFQTLVRALGGLVHVLNGETLATYNYWDPTRVIPATINEFPFFSFLFADLHPHMIGIPFTVLFLSLAYNWLRPENRRMSEYPTGHRSANERIGESANTLPGTGQRMMNNASSISPFAIRHSLIRPFLRWLALPFVLGAVAVINTWDLPTYLGLMLAAFLLSHYRRMAETFTFSRALFLLARGVLFAGTLLAVTYLLYAPFFANYQAVDVGLGLVHTKTPLDQHLKIWGAFLFILVTWLWISLLYPATRHSLLRAISLVLRRWNVWPHLTEIYRKLVKPEAGGYQLGLWSIGAVLLVVIVLALLGYRVPAYLFPPVMLALVLLFRRETTSETAYLGLLTFTGLLVLLGVEFFFLRDFLGGGDHYRMNTLFKFFIQVWVMFGLVAAVTLPQIWQWGWRWPLPAQLGWQVGALLLLMASLIYPVLGTSTRIDDRFPGDYNRPAIGTLDGMAYMTVGTFEWPAGSPVELKYDYEAIRWLQDHVPGTPVIAEAKIGYYREGGMRVAAYTGLPSVLGGLHQNEQRYASQLGERDHLVSEFWTIPDSTRTLQLIDELGISYIYVGQIERITYGNYIEQKFEQLRTEGELELVFKNEKTKIYKRGHPPP